MSEQKITLPSVRNQDRKKVNKLLKHIPMDSIIELNKLIYSGTKLIRNKIGIPLRNLNRNTKLGWEMKIERQIKKL